MARMEQLPFWRDANLLLPVAEQAMRRFPHYRRYMLATAFAAWGARVSPLALLPRRAFSKAA